MKRYYILDQFRGFTIISMVLFHMFYDINIFIDIPWYTNPIFNHIWQLSIAMSFFLISGITSNFLSGKKNIERGIKISILGVAITLVTYIFDRSLLIVFGVLNGLGISMIIVGLLEGRVDFKAYQGLIFFILFILTYRIPKGEFLGRQLYLSIYDYNIFPLGFPSTSFYSTDYFPIIPWIFIYLSGYIWGKKLIEKDFYNIKGRNDILAKIGQHSLGIYLVHQVVIYLLVYGFFTYIN